MNLESNALTYTVPQAATVLGVGTRTLQDLIASGDLESVKIGRRRLIRREALNRYLESRIARVA